MELLLPEPVYEREYEKILDLPLGTVKTIQIRNLMDQATTKSMVRVRESLRDWLGERFAADHEDNIYLKFRPYAHGRHVLMDVWQSNVPPKSQEVTMEKEREIEINHNSSPAPGPRPRPSRSRRIPKLRCQVPASYYDAFHEEFRKLKPGEKFRINMTELLNRFPLLNNSANPGSTVATAVRHRALKQKVGFTLAMETVREGEQHWLDLYRREFDEPLRPRRYESGYRRAETTSPAEAAPTPTETPQEPTRQESGQRARRSGTELALTLMHAAQSLMELELMGETITEAHLKAAREVSTSIFEHLVDLAAELRVRQEVSHG